MLTPPYNDLIFDLANGADGFPAYLPSLKVFELFLLNDVQLNSPSSLYFDLVRFVGHSKD